MNKLDQKENPMTREFEHDHGLNPDKLTRENCGACALTDTRQRRPNYAAWPLAYMENLRIIPAKWRPAFVGEMNSDNEAYAANVRATMERLGARFNDNPFTYRKAVQNSKGRWILETP